MNRDRTDSAELARTITRSASLQTFTTIRLLADRGRAADAYRAYAYFRWVDDWIDAQGTSARERQGFVERQRLLIEGSLAGAPTGHIEPEEELVVELVRRNPDGREPIAAYVHNMLSVMTFDAARRGRLISQSELNAYQHSLSVAVTEAMHYFIGRGMPAPRGPDRYHAVTAAHIVHMLRDTHEDVRAGYFNIPAEYLRAHGIGPEAIDSPGYSVWVAMRVALARRYFASSRRSLLSVGCRRCRLAAFAYTARFELVLEQIERDGFRLRPGYGGSKTLGAGLRMGGSVVAGVLGLRSLSSTPVPAAGDASGGEL